MKIATLLRCFGGYGRFIVAVNSRLYLNLAFYFKMLEALTYIVSKDYFISNHILFVFVLLRAIDFSNIHIILW